MMPIGGCRLERRLQGQLRTFGDEEFAAIVAEPGALNGDRVRSLLKGKGRGCVTHKKVIDKNFAEFVVGMNMHHAYVGLAGSWDCAHTQ